MTFSEAGVSGGGGDKYRWSAVWQEPVHIHAQLPQPRSYHGADGQQN